MTTPQLIQNLRQQRAWWASLTPEQQAEINEESAIIQTIDSMAIEGEVVTRAEIESACGRRSHAISR